MSARGGAQNVYRADADGTNVVQLTHTREPFANLHPTWSPDGDTIMWTAAWHGGTAVYMMHRDGSGKTRANVTVGRESQARWGTHRGLDSGDDLAAARPAQSATSATRSRATD
jgi:Tol biopolymer transport system component